MLVRPPQPKKVRALDYAVRALTTALPGAATQRIDQLRRDLTVLSDAARGDRPDPVATTEAAVRKAPDLEDVDLLDLLGRRGEFFRATRRDYETLRNALVRGERPSPLVARKPRQQPDAATDTNGTNGAGSANLVAVPRSLTVTRKATVTRVVRETDDAVSLYVAEQDGSPIDFVAGQFLSVDVVVAGERLRRAYSIAAPVGEAAHITIKRVADGRVSNQLNDTAEEGMTLDILGPSGAFTFAPNAGRPAQHILLVAGGSGITPVISIAETALRHSDARVTLLYGNRGQADVIFYDRLNTLRDTFADRFVLDHVLSAPPEGWSGGVGLLDAATQRARLGALGIDQQTLDAVDAFYVCGPTPMMDAARELLTDLGAADRLHEERFSRPEARTEGRGADTPQALTIRTAAGEATYTVMPGKTLLEAASDGGAAMPFSCAMGGCGACKMHCVSGDIDMDEPNCLTRKERDAGYVLTCVSHPRGPVTLQAPEESR